MTRRDQRPNPRFVVSRRGFWLRLAVYGGLLLMGFLLMPHVVGKMLYPAPAVRVPAQPPEPIEPVTWTNAAGQPQISWLQAQPQAGHHTPVVIYFHGNGENLRTMWETGQFQDWAGLGVHFLAVDYPGYGLSQGRPTEASLFESGRLAGAWVAERFPRAPIIVAGWSLGAAVAVHAAPALGDRAQGLMLFSPWESLREVAGAHFPRWLVNLLVADEYHSAKAASQINLPSLVVHGGRDAIIPAEQGARVAQALGGVRWILLPQREHNDLMMDPAVWREIDDFLKRILPPGEGTESTQ